MKLGLGSPLTRRLLIILALLLAVLMLGVKVQLWFTQRDEALVQARVDADKIEAAAGENIPASGPTLPPILAYRRAAQMTADAAADERAQDGRCDWQGNPSLTLIFDAHGAPVREPTAQGTTDYPGSSVPGVMESALTRWDIRSGPLRSGVSLGIHAKDAPCLVDGTAVGVLARFPGGAFAAMRLITFDWAGYLELLLYAVGALVIFWLTAQLVEWQFNVALNRRISRITAVLQTVEQNGFSDRVPVDGGSEFEILGNAINAMIMRVGLAQNYFADLNRFVAHNLRSPLTVARRLVESLVRAPGDDPSSLLSELDLQLIELDQRCCKLLDMAKLETSGAHRSEPVDMANVIARLVEDIFSYLARDREMEIDLYLMPAMVAMPDATQEIIIDNLLQNALKFGEHGTTVRVDLDARDGKARLSIVNRGPSVPPESFDAIFKRGVTTDGHGLGLYAVRTLVTLNGGDAAALPEDGGFRVLVTLPLAKSLSA